MTDVKEIAGQREGRIVSIAVAIVNYLALEAISAIFGVPVANGFAGGELTILVIALWVGSVTTEASPQGHLLHSKGEGSDGTR